MAEFQENCSKFLSVSSSENRGSVDSSHAEAQAGDEEFYEEIEAPKYVDFTVPDHYRPDDRYWFCLRVGCDQKHEEEMDSEAIYKKFVLRVMAARSPNVRLRKALERNASRTPIKCPLSAPPKPSKPRVSKMAIISSISQKMGDNKKGVVKPLLKPRPTTPVTKAKPVAAKYLTTPRNKNCFANQNSFRSVQNPKTTKVEVRKSRMVAKALVFHSPKKAIKVKSSVELRTPISKLCEASQKKRALGYSSKSTKLLGNNRSTTQLSTCKAQRKPKQLLHSQTCTADQETKSGRSIKSKNKEKLSQQPMAKKLLRNDHSDSSKNNDSHEIKRQLAEEVPEDLEEEACMSSAVPPSTKNPDLASLDESKGEGNCLNLEATNNSGSQATDRQEKNMTDESENSISENRGESIIQLNVNNSSERERNVHDFMDGDDKENAAACDENRMHNKDLKHNGRKIFSRHAKCGQVEKKVSQPRDKSFKEGMISPVPVMKAKKPTPTNPKPFRLRTDERGVLKEASLERRTDTPAPPSERANLNTPAGKLQRKQGHDTQKMTMMVAGLKIPKGKERSKTAASVTPESNRIHERKLMKSPLEGNANQRLEKFRKMKSPLHKSTVMRQGLVPTKKETISFLSPGQKLDVIQETSSEVSEQRSAMKPTGNVLATDAAACAASRSTSRGRKPTTVATEANFHSAHAPRTCATKLK